METKQQAKHPNMSGYIPPHIPFEIFTTKIFEKLDLKTLVLCSSVCKRWKSFLTSPSFHSFHKIRSYCLSISTNEEEEESILFQICRIERDVLYTQEAYKIYSKQEQEDGKILKLRALKSPPIDRFKNIKSFFTVVGSSSGLVCLSDFNCCSLFFWNPILRKYLFLPRHYHHLLDKVVLGFGFDHVNNDFKLVKLISKRSNVLDETWVFSLETRSWKLVIYNHDDDNNLAPPQCDVCEEKTPLLMDGKIHWIAKSRRSFHNIILSFDLAQETFEEIKLPQKISVRCPMSSISAFNLMGSLAVTNIQETRSRLRSTILRVWVMKEYGIMETWTNILEMKFKHSDEMIPRDVVFMRKNGEMIIEERGGSVVCFNPKTKKIQELGVRKRDNVFVGYLGESLVFKDKDFKESGIMSY